MDIGIFLFSTVVCTYSCRSGRRRSNSLRDRLLAGTSRDASERVCTVSKDNVPTLEGALRKTMRLENLWHRATYILVIQKELHSCDSDNDNDDGTDHHYNGNAGGPTVFVQKRSSIKDYCPSKLDVTPGGVVGFEETYQENAEREIFEEMGIDVSPNNNLGNTMTRLFTFPYEDDIVRVWGDFYVVHYYGSREDLVVQKEEVDDVLVMSMDELRRQIDDSPDKFMPDSCHAMRLYFQRTVDVQVNRRLLGKGYSSGDLDCYGLRPKPSVIFMDCDDCLYFDGWKTAGLLTQKIEDWCVQNAGLPPGKAYELYKQYGTALKGLLAEGYIENTPEAIDQFLKEVHDIPIHELIQPDPALRDMLLKLDPDIPKYIFTASVSHHAVRCLKALGVEDIFEDIIIDVKQCDLETKHSVHSFHAAMKIANVDDPESCVFFDDNIKNIKAAREIGWRSVLVGKIGRDCGKPISSDDAELEVERIHDIADVLPELFDYSLGSEGNE